MYIEHSVRLLSAFIGIPVAEVDSFALMKHLMFDDQLVYIFFGQDSLRDDKFFFFEFDFDSFFKKYFQSFHEDFANSALLKKQIDKIFEVDVENLAPKKTFQTLIHHSNLARFRDSCKSFWNVNLDKDRQSPDLSYWQKAIMVRNMQPSEKDYSPLELSKPQFEFLDFPQTEVVCAYVEYVVGQSLLLPKGGSHEMFHLTQLFAESMTRTLSDLEGFVLKIFNRGFVNFVQKNHEDLDCKYILGTSSLIESDSITLVCRLYAHKKDSKASLFSDLYNNCNGRFFDITMYLKQDEILDLCTVIDSEKVTLSSLMTAYNTELKAIYKTETVSFREMALLQMTQSTLTMNPNPYLPSNTFVQGASVHAWDSSLFDKPFEMLFFVEKYQLNDRYQKQMSLDSAKLLFNSATSLNAPVLLNCVQNAFKGDFTVCESLLSVAQSDFDDFWIYLVLYVRQYHLKGFHLDISRAQLDSGLDMPFLKSQQQKPVLLGGDPTMENPMSLKLQKMGALIRKKSGRRDYEQIDNVRAINNFEIGVSYFPFFNGNTTDLHSWNPWRREIKINGCEVFCFESKRNYANLEEVFREKKNAESLERASMEDQGISVYNYRFNRTVSFDFNSSRTDPNDFIINKFILNQRQFRANQPDFHQQDLQGFFNITSVVYAPLLVSQNHLFNTDSRLAAKFEYRDQNGTRVHPVELEDGGFYEVEGDSKLVVSMMANFHYTLQIQRSLLFLDFDLERELDGLKVGGFILAPLFNLEYLRKIDEVHFPELFDVVLRRKDLLGKFYAIVVPFFLVFGVLAAVVVFFFKRQRKRDYCYEMSMDDDFEERLVGHENMHMDL